MNPVYVTIFVHIVGSVFAMGMLFERVRTHGVDIKELKESKEKHGDTLAELRGVVQGLKDSTNGLHGVVKELTDILRVYPPRP